MAQTIEQKLLQAIEKDDIKAFDDLTDQAQCGSCRLGRFPVLSLLYLYNSRKIISAYEQKLLEISVWEELGEPASVVKLFSEKAGKCLRLYFGKIVSPLEMLLILDKTRRLKKLCPAVKPSEAVKTRLKAIYYVKYSLGIKFDGDNIIIDRHPLSRRQKKKLIAAAIGCLMAVAVIVTVPIVTVSYIRNHAWDVTNLSQIDFVSQKTYKLKDDITIPENYSVEKVNCTIIGGGYTLVLGKNASLGELNGKISGLRIQSFGNPIFTVCTVDAVLSDITVTVDVDVQTTESSALIAITNYGTFDGVTVNIGGSVSALAGDSDGTSDLVFGGMVMVNSYSYNRSSQPIFGTIKNCSVNYTDLSLKGETMANASFGGIVGVNNGVVKDCTVTGTITANTFDLAGACYENYYTLSGIVNRARLSQTSDDDGWSPIVGGIVINNAATVEYCQNMGSLSVQGQDLAICGGIAARTCGQNNYCMSSGEIIITAKAAYVGGIFGMSEVVTDGRYVYLGTANYCISRAKIDASLDEGPSCVGGIGGFVQERTFNQYKYDDYGRLVPVYYGGGVTNCIFMGGVIGSFNYFGNIVGVCGVNVYEQNSYISDNAELPNFAGNYYIENALSAFGAAAVSDEEFIRVDGKGTNPSTEEEIKGTAIYKDILEKLGL